MIACKPYPVWLDSPACDGLEILACSPTKVIIESKDQSGKSTTKLHTPDKEVSLDVPALDYLRTELEKCSHKSYEETTHNSNLDGNKCNNKNLQQDGKDRTDQRVNKETIEPVFTGGWIGIVSYEAGEDFPGIQSDYKYKHPVCEERIIFGYYSEAIIIDHKNKTAWHYSESGSEFIIANPSDSDKGSASITPTLDSQAKSQFKLQNRFTPDTDKTRYKDDILRIKKYLADGDCYQVNYSQRFHSSYQGDPIEAYAMLRQSLSAPFSCYFNWGESTLLSFSPERFIQLENNVITTEPIKGTSPRYQDSVLDTQSRYKLKNSSKDQAENLMIVDLLRNDLGRIAEPGTVIVDELFGLYSFSNVHHLVSRIKAHLASNKSSVDMISHCFPGGSITGAPKKRAMEIINELEPTARDFYCGSLFVFSNSGYCDSNILIRTLLCKQEDNNQGNIYCWAGGGIVIDSNPESEFEECFNKINAIIGKLEKSMNQ